LRNATFGSGRADAGVAGGHSPCRLQGKASKGRFRPDEERMNRVNLRRIQEPHSLRGTTHKSDQPQPMDFGRIARRHRISASCREGPARGGFAL
jgi:hypothetical protein